MRGSRKNRARLGEHSCSYGCCRSGFIGKDKKIQNRILRRRENILAFQEA